VGFPIELVVEKVDSEQIIRAHAPQPIFEQAGESRAVHARVTIGIEDRMGRNARHVSINGEGAVGVSSWWKIF
jgi:hypothetical protein